MDKLLIAPAIFLPLIPEPISDWSSDTDVIRLIHALSAETAKDAFQAKPSAFLANNTIEQAAKLSREFAESVCQRREQRPWDDTPLPEFGRDADFGLMAKYHLTWAQLLWDAAGKHRAFSLTHMYETMSELDCTRHLAKGFFYKQAIQVLRNFIEELVISLYFIEEPAAFDKWTANRLRAPSVRGKDGMLETLIKRGVLDQSLGDDVSKVYEKLNGSIHSLEFRMLHRFNEMGPSGEFDVDSLHEWCQLSNESVRVGIDLLLRNVAHWESKPSSDWRACSKCGNVDKFSILSLAEVEGSESYGSNPIVELVYVACDRCGLAVLRGRDSLPDAVKEAGLPIAS